MEEQTNIEKGDIGSMIGTIVVIALLIIGAFYFFGQRIQKQKQIEANIAQTASSSDEISSLKSDVNSINVDGLGGDVNNL